MSITASTIAVTPGSGILLDAVSLTVGANVVDREIVAIGSPSTPGNYAEVNAAYQLQVNQQVPTQDNIVTGAGGSNATICTVSVQGCSVCVVTVAGTFGGLVEFQISFDGTNFNYVLAYPINLTTTLSGGPVYVTNSAAGQWMIPCAGAQLVRAVMASYASGTANVTLDASQGQSVNQILMYSGDGFPLISDGNGGIKVTLQTASATINILGTKGTNSAAPGTTNLGVLPAVANAVPQVLTEGDQVLESTDLSGNTRVLASGQPLKLQAAAFASSGSVTSLACAYPSNVRAGTMLFMVAAVGNGTQPTITDTVNTWQLITPWQLGTSSAFGVGIFACVSKTAGALTATVNNGGTAASIAAEIYEVSGLSATTQAESTSNLTNASSTNIFTSALGSITPNDFCILGIGVGTAAQTMTFPTANAAFESFITNDSGTKNPTTPAGLFSFAAGSGVLPVSFQFGTSLQIATLGVAEPTVCVGAIFRPYQQAVGGLVTVAGSQGGAAFGVGSNSVTVTNAIPVSSIGGGAAEGDISYGEIVGNATTGIPAKANLLFTSGSNASTVFARTPAVLNGGYVQSGVATIWSPTIGKKVRLMRYRLSMSADTTIASGSAVLLGFAQGLASTTGGLIPIQPMFNHRVFVPSSAITGAALLWNSDWIDLGNGYLQGTASFPLQLGISVPQSTSAITPAFGLSASEQWEAATIGFKTTGNLGIADLRQQVNVVAAAGVASCAAISTLTGNTIIVITRTTNITGGAPTCTVTDTAGNTYTNLALVTNASDSTHGSSLVISYCINAVGNAANVIHFAGTVNVPTEVMMIALEYQGITAIGGTGQTGTTGSSNAPGSGSYTPGEVGDLIITACASQCAGVVLTAQPTIAAGYTMRGTIFTAAGALAVADNFGNGTLSAGCVEAQVIGTEE
jgi:hypothetical protein